MAINFHPKAGAILICDFRNMEAPEMQKKRPVIVVSPRLRYRDRLCTVVPLSTTPPNRIEPYHYKLYTVPPLPGPYDSEWHWVKADMLYTVSFARLSVPCIGKAANGQRVYDQRVIDDDEFEGVRSAVMAGLGFVDE